MWEQESILIYKVALKTARTFTQNIWVHGILELKVFGKSTIIHINTASWCIVFNFFGKGFLKEYGLTYNFELRKKSFIGEIRSASQSGN